MTWPLGRFKWSPPVTFLCWLLDLPRLESSERPLLALSLGPPTPNQLQRYEAVKSAKNGRNGILKAELMLQFPAQCNGMPAGLLA